MKYIVIIITTLFLFSCSTYQGYTGQRFVEESPTFYLSIAPSFAEPYEYEVKNRVLVFRKYSGLGGYNWGRKRVVAKSGISQEEQESIRALTLEAIADTISIEKKRKESGEVIVVLDGTGWYIQSDLDPFLTISTNNPESKAFSELLNLLKLILKREPSNA